MYIFSFENKGYIHFILICSFVPPTLKSKLLKFFTPGSERREHGPAALPSGQSGGVGGHMNNPFLHPQSLHVSVLSSCGRRTAPS